MIDFIIVYFKEIIAVCLFLIEFLFSILILSKKGKSGDSAFDIVLRALPSYITIAESKYGAGNGEKKLDHVMNMAIFMYKELSGCDVTKDSFIGFEIQKAIEDILQTPTKK